MYSDWGVFNIDMYLVDCDSACVFQIEKKTGHSAIATHAFYWQ